MKKMVITGVNGFIGRHAKEYFEKEYEITGLDLAANYCGDRQPGDTMTYYQCNMSQESAEMAAIFTGVQPDVILHCAGSANVGASVVNPMADLDGNLHSLYQLLLALKSFEKRPQIIFLSSAGIYGNPRQLPVRESDAAAPMSPYGLHKHMAEELCEYYNRIHGYRIRSIRIFSAYGNGLRKQLLWDIYQKYQNTGRIELFGNGRGDARFHSCLRNCTCELTDPCLLRTGKRLQCRERGRSIDSRAGGNFFPKTVARIRNSYPLTACPRRANRRT